MSSQDQYSLEGTGQGSVAADRRTRISLLWEDDPKASCPIEVSVNGRRYQLVFGEHSEMVEQARRLVAQDKEVRDKEKRSRKNKENYYRRKQDPVWWEKRKEYQRKRYQARKADEQKVQAE